MKKRKKGKKGMKVGPVKLVGTGLEGFVDWVSPTFRHERLIVIVLPSRLLESTEECEHDIRCLVKNSLHDDLSRISIPPANHPIAYDMFVMDNTKNIFYPRIS